MKYTIYGIILAGVTLCSSMVLAEQRYVNGIEDLPVPEGFVEQKDHTLIYDTLSGQVIEALYEGQSTLKDIKNYYADTLPELGWKKVAMSLYEREDEQLQLKLSREDGNRVAISFTLRPK